MVPHRPHNGGSSRVVSPSADVMQNTSSRLPTRAAISASTSISGTSSPSKLVKKRPSTRRGLDLPTMDARSPPSGGVRRLAGSELRRELEQSALPTHTRYTSAIASPPNQRTHSRSRPPVSEPARTPSLVSGSSASTQDSPRSNRLRRKHSNIAARQHIRTSPDSASSQDESAKVYKDPYPDAVLGIAMPPVSSAYASRVHHDDIIQLDQYVLAHNQVIGNDLPTPTPLYALSTSTPSTGYSPGPFSISSTPTSMSSASPGFVTSTASRTKQPSPIRSRPSATRAFAEETSSNTRTRGLAPVRESSSSSTSTLRGGETNRSRSKSRVKPMPPPSPSPPPQLSSTSHHRRVSSGAKSMHSGAATAGKSQVLPEFAHLVDSSPRKSSLSGATPPIRPSRDGAPEFLVQQKSPVVQSNMSSLPAPLHKRQSSTESKRAIAPLTLDTSKSRFGLPRTRTVSPSPSQSSALSPRTTAPPTRGFTPDYPSESEGSSRIRPSPTVESKPFSRFGLFSKKNKNDTSTTAASKEKKSRKGPVAGTGHEGYGRFAFRGRSGSTTSSTGTTNAGRSPSADSAIGTVPPRSRKSSFGSKNGSNSDFEDFLAEREKPITIRGGQAAVRPAIERSQTEGSHADDDETRAGQFVAPSWNSSEASLEPPKRPVLLPSPMSDPAISGSPVKRDLAVQAQKEEKSSLPSLASLTSRRTSRRSFLGGKALAVAQQAEHAAGISDRKGSNASQSQDGSDLIQSSLKPPSRWNFLQRSKSPARQATPAPVMEPAARPATKRSIAHYAMVGGASRTLDADELEKIMQEAEGSTPEDASNSETEQKLRARKKGKAPMRHGQSILLPDPPKLPSAYPPKQRPALPKIGLQSPPQRPLPEQPDAGAATSPQAISIVGQPRPSRLPQVGRIPRVVSKRDRERKLPDNSFSRPFQPMQPSPALKYGPLSPSVSSPESIQASFTALPDLAMASATKGMQTPSDGGALSPHYSPPLGFMSFGRKNSEQSTRSSGSAYFNVLATTAMIPAPDAPFSDDEIWGEYDDLEDMFAGKALKTPKTPLTSSSLGAPFQYAEFSPKDAIHVDRPSTAPMETVAETSPEVPQVPTLASIAHQIRIPSMHDSRIISSLPSAGTPNSPFRMSDFVGSYGERNLSVIDPLNGRLSLMPSNNRLSGSTNGRYSLPATIRPQSVQHAQTLPSTRHTPSKSESSGRDSRIMERAETEYMGFENLANLRFGALMTSKWLSFGRVLFSPAHLELNTRGENRVLVLDGLGKDWSFYVALNYPNASVYNLGTEPADAEQVGDSANPIQSLPNHRHIHHPSLRDPFPFPKGFFAAVVFRFPIATTESAYKSAIFECKRVLRPGGYLEISALDMDMMNMGSRARAALRRLKTQIQSEDSSVSLKPLSDTFQRLLYRRGFENLNRCIVGIPAAGRIPGSRDEGSTPEPHSASVESSTGSSKRMDEDMPSFGDLFLSSGQAGDEGVTKMVSKVGRWWYSRCYESLILPNGDLTRSIWTDDALVRECEKRSTNLRLMICYAQKPDCPVRRTISV